MLGRSQFELIQMPTFMEFGSNVHLEALVSMIELNEQFNTVGSRSFPELYIRYAGVCLSRK